MVHNTVWQCKHSFGGHIFETKTFETREDAVQFASQLSRVAPEATFTIAPVDVKHIWN